MSVFFAKFYNTQSKILRKKNPFISDFVATLENLICLTGLKSIQTRKFFKLIDWKFNNLPLSVTIYYFIGSIDLPFLSIFWSSSLKKCVQILWSQIEEKAKNSYQSRNVANLTALKRKFVSYPLPLEVRVKFSTDRISGESLDARNGNVMVILGIKYCIRWKRPRSSLDQSESFELLLLN